MPYQPQITFNLDTSSNDFGKITSVIINNSISSGVTENVYYKITSPSNVVLKRRKL